MFIPPAIDARTREDLEAYRAAELAKFSPEQINRRGGSHIALMNATPEQLQQMQMSGTGRPLLGDFTQLPITQFPIDPNFDSGESISVSIGQMPGESPFLPSYDPNFANPPGFDSGAGEISAILPQTSPDSGAMARIRLSMEQAAAAAQQRGLGIMGQAPPSMSQYTPLMESAMQPRMSFDALSSPTPQPQSPFQSPFQMPQPNPQSQSPFQGIGAFQPQPQMSQPQPQSPFQSPQPQSPFQMPQSPFQGIGAFQAQPQMPQSYGQAPQLPQPPSQGSLLDQYNTQYGGPPLNNCP